MQPRVVGDDGHERDVFDQRRSLFLAPNLDQAKSNEFTKAICRVMAPWLISRSRRSTTIIFIGERDLSA